MVINSLNKRQQLIADVLWGASSEEELEELIDMFPEKDKNDAKAIADIMVMGGDEVLSLRDAEIVLNEIMYKC
ncbi:MAG: hypothetical protein EBZ49_01740 [Proteobacteria bacterium]|jgi:hypothetical protein|nr:hypothetical protein [Pseudomonadota bacterium]